VSLPLLSTGVHCPYTVSLGELLLGFSHPEKQQKNSFSDSLCKGEWGLPVHSLVLKSSKLAFM
jgi:hypothetical protein